MREGEKTHSHSQTPTGRSVTTALVTTARIQAAAPLQTGLPRYQTPREVAAILRRSVKSLYRLISADPTFPKTRLPGGGLLIPRLALEQWLRDRSEGIRGPVRLAVVPPTSTVPQRTAGADALNGGGS